MKRLLFILSWPFRRLSIALSLFLVINILTGIGFFFAYRNMDQTYQAFQRREEEVQLNLVNRLTYEVDREMGYTFQVFENFTESISYALQMLGFESAYRNFQNRGTLKRFMQRNPQVVSLVIRDILHREYVENSTADLQAADFADALNYASSQALAGQPFHSPILKSERSAAPIILLSEPVKDAGGTVVASITVLLSLRPLIQNLLAELPSDYQLFIVDTKGQLLLHSKTAFRDQAEGLFKSGADYTSHPLVKSALESGGRINQVLSYSSFEHRPFLGCAAPSSFLPWSIAIEISRETAFATVIQMRARLKQWLIVTLISSTLLAFIMAHAFRIPLGGLLEGSKRVAAKHFSRPIELHSSNEFGLLARQFNKMQRSIQLYLDQIREAALKQKETLLKAIHALVNAIDAKDPYTKGHSRRVSKFTRIIALEMGQSGQLLERTELSALLHDVGKIGIDDNILKKPAQLTDEEYEIMKTHPEKGFKILGAIEDLQPITDGMRFHHENYGGGGYPLGLKGEAIPLQARIVAVADAFDAMTTNRPYQMAMSWEDSVNRLNELSGKRFDPKVVSAVTQAFYSGRLKEEDF